jgi:hypothetical protein
VSTNDNVKKERDRQFVQLQFQRRAGTAGNWVIAAIPLKRASDYLSDLAEAASERDLSRVRAQAESLKLGFSQPGPRDMTAEEVADMWDESLRPVAFMLLGLAFENLLKAVLVRRGLVSVTGGI